MCELISWLMAAPEDQTRSLLQVHDPQLVRQTVEARTISWVSDLLLGYLPHGVFVLGHLLRLSIVEHRGRPTSAAWNSLRSASAGLSGCKARWQLRGRHQLSHCVADDNENWACKDLKQNHHHPQHQKGRRQQQQQQPLVPQLHCTPLLL